MRKLTSEIQSYKDEVSHLQQQVDILRKIVFGQKSEKTKKSLIKYSASITQSDFSSDYMEIPKLYWRMLRDFRAR